MRQVLREFEREFAPLTDGRPAGLRRQVLRNATTLEHARDGLAAITAPPRLRAVHTAALRAFQRQAAARQDPRVSADRSGTVPAMAKLIYSAIASLDGYVADEDGKWDWSMPDEAVHAFVNDLARPVGTWLLGRRLYDVLVAWETMDDEQPEIRDFAEIWRSADKVVYSRTLEEPSSARTRIEREFDPEAVSRMKDESERDLSVGGPELAAQAFRAGLVDEVQLFLSPIVVGGGNAALPDDVRVPLELLDERRFGNGVVYLQYGVTT